MPARTARSVTQLCLMFRPDDTSTIGADGCSAWIVQEEGLSQVIGFLVFLRLSVSNPVLGDALALTKQLVQRGLCLFPWPTLVNQHGPPGKWFTAGFLQSRLHRRAAKQLVLFSRCPGRGGGAFRREHVMIEFSIQDTDEMLFRASFEVTEVLTRHHHHLLLRTRTFPPVTHLISDVAVTQWCTIPCFGRWCAASVCFL